MDTPIDTYNAHRIFKKKSTELMQEAPPGEYNQALMEFGALQCIPKPNCEGCVFIDDCVAFQQDRVSSLPVKSKKINIKIRFFDYIVIIDEQNKTILEKRTAKDIWRNLYQFPLIEQYNRLETLRESSLKKLLSKYNIDEHYLIEKWNEKPIIHKLTHQHLKINFWILNLPNSKKLNIEWSKVDSYPMPKVLENFKENFFIN
jgi:A/G-specific adenine glycosylase